MATSLTQTALRVAEREVAFWRKQEGGEGRPPVLKQRFANCAQYVAPHPLLGKARYARRRFANCAGMSPIVQSLVSRG